MKFRLFSLILLIALTLAGIIPLAAQEATPEGFPLTIIDGAGRELTFDAPPQRVMCYYTDCIEALVGLGLKPAYIPEWFVQYPNPTLLQSPNGISDVTLIPVQDGVTNAEAIIAQNPDLIMVYGVEETQTFEGLASTFVSYPVNTIDDAVNNLQQYGEVFGREAEAQQAIGRFTARRMAYAQLSPRDVTVMNVLIDLADPTAGELGVRSTNSPDCVLLNEIAQCPWDTLEVSDSWSFRTNIEYILEQDPDFILISAYEVDGESLREQFVQDPLWGELSAVKNNRLIVINDDLSADGVMIATRFLDHVAPVLYPDIFPDGPLTDAQVQEILAEEAAASSAQFPVTVVDADNASLTFTQAPERIVCLTNGCVENMAMIGVMPIAVGAVNYAIAIDPVNFGEAAADIVQIAAPDGSPDFEQIASLDPDLVVGWSDLRASLEGIAPLYAQYYSSENLDAFLLNTRNLGMITGRSDYTEEQIQSALDRVEAYSRLSPRDKSLFITQLSGDQPVFWSYPTNTFNTCGIIERVATCVYPESDSWQEMSMEGLLSIDPDMIVLAKYDPSGTTVEDMLSSFEQNEPLWNELRAVENGAVYVFPPTQVEGYTIQSAVAMLDRVMPLLYPETFPDGPLTDEQVQEILAKGQ